MKLGLRPSPLPPTLSDKVAFLSRPAAYGRAEARVTRLETHMSWVFFVDGTVFKLKKPVHLPYLDFSSLAQREAACRAEVSLNQALAPGVYLGVGPITMGAKGLTVGGEGQTVDWLVIMRRLDERLMLDKRLTSSPPSNAECSNLTRSLEEFYRHTSRVRTTPALHRLAWRRALDANRATLLTPRLGLPAGQVRGIDIVMRRFLRIRHDTLDQRVRERRIIDAHGDLRPEHIWLGSEVRIIDRLEFNAALRATDPLDELAFLDLECERLGAAATGRRIRLGVERSLRDPAPLELLLFYRCHRAMLRTRLSIAHLLEPHPRTPQKWSPQARAYLNLAMRDAVRLAVLLNRPADR